MIFKVNLIGAMGLVLTAASPMPNPVLATPTMITTSTTTTTPTTSPSTTSSFPDLSSSYFTSAIPSAEEETLTKPETSRPIPAALNQPAVTEAPHDIDAAVWHAFTSRAVITVVNRHGADLTTMHVNGEGLAAHGHAGAGTLAHGAEGVFTVHDGWSGRVALNEAGRYVRILVEFLLASES